MAIQKINSSDKLQSGFRAKYNTSVDEIIVSISDQGNGVLRFTKFSTSYFDVDLTDSFYTKDQIMDLIDGLGGPASYDDAGIIEIATEDEAIAGESEVLAITPYTLNAFLTNAGIGRKSTLDIPSSPADITINWQTDLAPGSTLTYAEKHGNSIGAIQGVMIDPDDSTIRRPYEPIWYYSVTGDNINQLFLTTLFEGKITII